MDQVPKILKPMVDDWTGGHGYIVSFKVRFPGSITFPPSIYVSIRPLSSKRMQRYSSPRLAVLWNDMVIKWSSETSYTPGNMRWYSSHGLKRSRPARLNRWMRLLLRPGFVSIPRTIRRRLRRILWQSLLLDIDCGSSQHDL